MALRNVRRKEGVSQACSLSLQSCGRQCRRRGHCWRVLETSLLPTASRAAPGFVV